MAQRFKITLLASLWLSERALAFVATKEEGAARLDMTLDWIANSDEDAMLNARPNREDAVTPDARPTSDEKMTSDA